MKYIDMKYIILMIGSTLIATILSIQFNVITSKHSSGTLPSSMDTFLFEQGLSHLERETMTDLEWQSFKDLESSFEDYGDVYFASIDNKEFNYYIFVPNSYKLERLALRATSNDKSAYKLWEKLTLAIEYHSSLLYNNDNHYSFIIMNTYQSDMYYFSHDMTVFTNIYN